MGQWKKANLANKKHIWIGILIILSIIGIVIFAIKVNAENTGGTAEQREDEETLVRMTASLSRASDSNNKVNIETLTELLNRYAVNGTTTVTEKSSDTILVTFVTTGNEYEINAEGLLAKAICHELDHLDGVLYTDKVIRKIED